MVTLYNTLTGCKEPLAPLVPGTVKLYACGVTVYDECHLGHARSALVFEVIRNVLAANGYAVTFVRNFTDIDDKILNRANQEGVAWTTIVERYLQAYRRDMGRLRIQAADVEPRATDHMPDMIRLIQTLFAKGHAYQVNGDVFFEVATYPGYGRLSKRKPEDLQAGARVEVDERKRHPMDFALWKASKPGEPSWESPWGPGRPGWHIECSAMSMRHLGETFDLHGGGMDLIFPHHENEIAQSCAATGKEFARVWVHNGFVNVNREKMSKSLGNFFTIREVFEKAGCREGVMAEVLRYFLLATHYRSPLDFSDQGLQEAKRALDGIYDVFHRLEEVSAHRGQADQSLRNLLATFPDDVSRVLQDDINTPAALAVFQRLRGDVNRLLGSGLSQSACREARQVFQTSGQVLGLFQLPVRDWEFKDLRFQVTGGRQAGSEQDSREHAASADLTDEAIQGLLMERAEARRRKDFARGDEIRRYLASRGITIEDRPDGTSRWKR
ncbi:MAG: cysteine--tRNA ligase [Nitrospirales bacterium]